MGTFDFGLIEPAKGAHAVVPSDAIALPRPSRGIYVGATGNLVVEMSKGQVVTFTDITAGIIHPLQVIRVLATGTTATNILIVF